ncbi:unnamed protein product [Closterium sp. NIES-53]
MAEHIDVTSLTQERLNELLQQLRGNTEEIAALTTERTSMQNDVARAQQTQSQTQGTHGQPARRASQHGSVGQPSSAASDGVARNDGDNDHGATHPGATNAARSQPRVTISVPTGESALPSPMPLKPQCPPCFDPSQRGGPTVQAWLFTMNVFFDANYASEDSAKIRYAMSLLRGPAMDWWRVIVTKSTDYQTLPAREGQTGPWAPSYFVEVPQYHTWDACCAGLRARFEPIAASIAARQRLRTWRQFGSVQDYTSGFLALCEQVGYMHEGERIDRYIGGLKHEIAKEIQMHNITEFNKILAMAENLIFFADRDRGPTSVSWDERARRDTCYRRECHCRTVQRALLRVQSAGAP